MTDAFLNDPRLRLQYNSSFYYDGRFGPHHDLRVDRSEMSGRIFHNQTFQGYMQLIKFDAEAQYVDTFHPPSSDEISEVIRGNREIGSTIAFNPPRHPSPDENSILLFHFRTLRFRGGNRGDRTVTSVECLALSRTYTFLMYVFRDAGILHTDVYTWLPGIISKELIDFILAKDINYVTFRFKDFRYEMTLFFNSTKDKLLNFRQLIWPYT